MKFRFRVLIGLCLSLTLCFSVWFSAAEASPSLLNPRINRLESQLRSLQSQVTRLQSQLPRTSPGRTTSSPVPLPDTPNVDQQFDTLAILIIELQDRVSALEAKLEQTDEPI
ncbi:hypothetical protein IQ260_29980 [Leptolyngbya cf. ectocarpi LEGE 11479]|uniref:Uncharacterized protein n=1 Tax=Leptolyngbya cf. ectocarpi LEGE 11479 TaxID=1828722 RepID=A0A929FDA6_LEPEC|nr:hypothetical protein [Leptolyngbya ectocarpi]MBE9070869.1 hypothetical protein [Leptolyngbya cf. ectocarpi LEGE 11479]